MRKNDVVGEIVSEWSKSGFMICSLGEPKASSGAQDLPVQEFHRCFLAVSVS